VPDLIGGAAGIRTPGLRIANGKKAIFVDHILGFENSTNLPKTLTKRSREQETDYEEVRPSDTHLDKFWQRFGNGKNELANTSLPPGNHQTNQSS
jgi:hypothetical protein